MSSDQIYMLPKPNGSVVSKPEYLLIKQFTIKFCFFANTASNHHLGKNHGWHKLTDSDR